MSSPSLSQRILARLEQAEVEELDPWLRDDLRIARLTVCYAANGEAMLCSPHVLASYMVLGLHPEKVWPAIQARRDALGSSYGPFLLEIPAPSVPKIPAQSVKLWSEKTNAARRAILRGGETLLRDNTISVPMAAPSIAALYPNSDAPSSAKKREYSLLELKRIVAYSGAPAPICNLTISALRARGEWPNEDGPATAVLSVAILGMMFEGVCCRSTVQRRIKRAVKEGYWRRVRDANSWTDCPKCGKKRSAAKCECGYKGRSRDENRKWTGEFMRVPVYEFDVRKFQTAQRCREIRHFDARTYLEYKESAKRGEHPNVTEMPRKPTQPAPPDPPPATAAPVRQPAAEHAHRNPTRVESPQPKLTKRECAKFMSNFEQRRRGRTTYFSRADGLHVALHPGEQGYAAPMSSEAAFAAECESWRREPDVVLHALKHWGYKLPSP